MKRIILELTPEQFDNLEYILQMTLLESQEAESLVETIEAQGRPQVERNRQCHA